MIKLSFYLIIIFSISLSIYAVNKDGTNFRKFKSESCPFGNGTRRESYRIGHCKDGTISFKQPSSEGRWSQEGMCGQTLVSNMYRMFCGWNYGPESADRYVRDITPGVSPNTLVKGLNKLFNSNSDCPYARWKKVVSNSPKEFIDEVANALSLNFSPYQVERRRFNGDIEKRSPVASLIKIPGQKILHWITIVDLEFINGKCKMTFNTWDDQYQAPCSLVAQWSRNVKMLFPLLDGLITISLLW